MKGQLSFRPIVSVPTWDAVIKLSKADRREAFLPTHVIMKDEYIVGSLSQVPTFLIWTDSQKMKVRDSQQVISFVEGLVACQGGHSLCLPVTESCPYRPYMEKANYQTHGTFELFFKGLKI